MNIKGILVPIKKHTECEERMGEPLPMNEALRALLPKDGNEVVQIADAITRLETLHDAMVDKLQEAGKAFFVKVEEAQPELKDVHYHLDWDDFTYQVAIPAQATVIRRPPWVDELLKENSDEGQRDAEKGGVLDGGQ